MYLGLVRNPYGTLFLGFIEQKGTIWCFASSIMVLHEDLFPEVTVENSPQEVEIKIKDKT